MGMLTAVVGQGSAPLKQWRRQAVDLPAPRSAQSTTQAGALDHPAAAESSQRLDRSWVVEPALGRLVGCRRLHAGYQRRADLLRTWLWPAGVLVCLHWRV
jgi:hypothetical protein